jgi:hypothetical protein
LARLALGTADEGEHGEQRDGVAGRKSSAHEGLDKGERTPWMWAPSAGV